jgi:subtilisin family serine protease
MSAAAHANEETIDILVQYGADPARAAAAIEEVGGVVRIEYENVPAIAASVPLSRLAEVANAEGVTRIEKDSLIVGPVEKVGHRPAGIQVDGTSVAAHAARVADLDIEALPAGYASFLITGAALAWEATGAGKGSIVAVVDTGTAPGECLAHAVVGAPGYPDGYNATGDGIPANSDLNHWHGTVVGGTIASSCVLNIDPASPLWLAMEAHLPWSDPTQVPLFGQAPEAEIYPIKVFDATGGSSATSIILDGLDHLITLKKEGLLDIDVVNMSLGGPTLWDGRDTFDRFVLGMWDTGMLVVTSASNDGPVPLTIGSPATAYNSIAVGALDHAASSRTFYEYLGLAIWPGAPGMGMIMRPTAETRVVNFSSRGPMADGRAGPDLAALGTWNFHEGTGGSLRWVTGTSFASPTVAGAAALLNAYWEANHSSDARALDLRRAIIGSADRDAVGTTWRGQDDVGWGALDVPAALDAFANRTFPWFVTRWSGFLRPNVLPCPRPGRVDTFKSDVVTLAASETTSYVLEVNEHTSRVTVEILGIDTPDNYDWAYWPNALEIGIQSAKRTAAARPVGVLWYPQFYGPDAVYEITDGLWTENGDAIAVQPMEPGLIKVTLAGDFSNESPVSFSVRIVRENRASPLRHPVARGKIEDGDEFVVPVDIPEGMKRATFDLVWKRDWRAFPTSDLDLLVLDPSSALVSIDGATLNSPEQAVVEAPEPGTWWLIVQGYELHRPDRYQLFVTME